jgi:hypothetical protein
MGVSHLFSFRQRATYRHNHIVACSADIFLHGLVLGGTSFKLPSTFLDNIHYTSEAQIDFEKISGGSVMDVAHCLAGKCSMTSMIEETPEVSPDGMLAKRSDGHDEISPYWHSNAIPTRR